MKKSLVMSFAVALTVCWIGVASAQCVGGVCAIPETFAPPAYPRLVVAQDAPAPCEAVGACQAVEAIEPCEAVEDIGACAPVAGWEIVGVVRPRTALIEAGRRPCRTARFIRRVVRVPACATVGAVRGFARGVRSCADGSCAF